MLNFFHPLNFLLYFLALIIAITIHEFAHAISADRLGDPTPRLQGRLTLNPLAHLDPLGTLMLFLVRFGWGKPVQFDPFNLRNPRKDAAIISFAGPLSNIALASLCSFILKVLPTDFDILARFLTQLILLNVVLAVFNLIPIHPLDGFKIVGGLLPTQQAKEWYTLEHYGIILLLLLLFPIFSQVPPIQLLISPPINFLLNLLLPQPPLL